MTNEQIKIDPDLGIWTPAFVEECLKSKAEEEFEALYYKPKEMVRALLNMAEVVPIENEEDEYEILSCFTPEERFDLESMHWRQFKAKYGSKPSDYIKTKGEKHEI